MKESCCVCTFRHSCFAKEPGAATLLGDLSHVRCCLLGIPVPLKQSAEGTCLIAHVTNAGLALQLNQTSQLL